MSEDWTWEDEARERFENEVSQRAIDEFKTEFRHERLKSFYQKNPTVAEPPLAALEEARRLAAASHNSAALVFAVVASEVFLKVVIVKGVVWGAVHLDSLTEHIAETVTKQTGADRFKELLNLIFAELGGIEFTAYKPEGFSKPLWETFTDSVKRRNNICHKGDTAPKEQADEAIAVARAMLEDIFPRMLQELGLHRHGTKVCAEWNCAPWNKLSPQVADMMKISLSSQITGEL